MGMVDLKRRCLPPWVRGDTTYRTLGGKEERAHLTSAELDPDGCIHRTFSTLLPLAVPLSGVVVQISPGLPDTASEWLPHPAGPSARAPVSGPHHLATPTRGFKRWWILGLFLV
jgi:hypothetical protein